MTVLNTTQVANFTYWMLEHRDSRVPKHIREIGGKTMLAYIEQVLIPEFLSKYPNGILTGW